jgi:dihydroorotate dehydrogenase (NAD+) catalytic subunit
MNAEDAIEFMLAGATAVEIGTANFINPRATTDIISGIEMYMKRHGINNMKEIIGSFYGAA